MAFILRPLVGNTKHNVQNYFDFVKKIKGITLKPEETIISYDVIGLCTSIRPTSAIDIVHQALLKDTNRKNLSCNQICDLLHLCLDNTYFSYNGQFINNIMAVRWVLQFLQLSQTYIWNNLNI